MRWRLGLVATGTALALLAAASGAAEERCGTCHPTERVEFGDSVHAREEVSCSACHGGRPDSLDVDTAHRGDFRPLGERPRIPESCASCHSDLERMRPYNLPVDQYAVYMTSRHGQAAAAGDPDAAVCSDCHGAHAVYSPDDPQSRVHMRNLPATCGECHADASLMDSYGLDPGVVEAYLSGAHGEALLERAVQAAPSCNSCHGVHGATPPGVGDIDKVCGNCHDETRRAFLEGPHYPSMAEAGLPECSSCHSNHGIRRRELAELTELCADCHGEDSEEQLVGAKINTLIVQARQEVEAAEELLVEAEKVPLHVEDHLGRIEEARTYLTEALPLVHAVSVEPVEQVTRRARSIGKEIQAEIHPRLSRRTAHIGLAVYWFYVVMTVAILIGYRRRLGRRSETG